MVDAHVERSAVDSTAGDVFRLQRDFLAGEAWLDATDRGVITVTGPDRLVWLHSLLSQDLLGLEPGVTTEAFILSPHGKIEHSLMIVDDEETTWLLAEPGHQDDVGAWLASMKFRMEVALAKPELRVIATWGPAEKEFASHSLVVFTDPWPQVSQGSVGYHEGDHPGSSWSVRYSAAPITTPDPIGQSAISREAFEGLAIAAARPSIAEVDEKSLPHELDWLRTAVHLNKGCYRGQESVAKVHNLGHPPRRLTLLHLDGTPSILPLPGEEVRTHEKSIGVVTRSAWHYELGPIALALLRRAAPLGEVTVLTSEGVALAANQEVIVPPDAGKAMPRRRL